MNARRAERVCLSACVCVCALHAASASIWLSTHCFSTHFTCHKCSSNSSSNNDHKLLEKEKQLWLPMGGGVTASGEAGKCGEGEAGATVSASCSCGCCSGIHNVHAHLYLFHFLTGNRHGKISLGSFNWFSKLSSAQLNLNLYLQQQQQQQRQQQQWQLKAIVDLMLFAANGSAAAGAEEAIDFGSSETVWCQARVATWKA